MRGCEVKVLPVRFPRRMGRQLLFRKRSQVVKDMVEFFPLRIRLRLNEKAIDPGAQTGRPEMPGR